VPEGSKKSDKRGPFLQLREDSIRPVSVPKGASGGTSEGARRAADGPHRAAERVERREGQAAAEMRYCASFGYGLAGRVRSAEPKTVCRRGKSLGGALSANWTGSARRAAPFARWGLSSRKGGHLRRLETEI